jgi:hypothetical protein
MNAKLIAMAILASVLATASHVQARPYLMLAADDKGFEALDLGDVHQEGIETAQITVIDAPLAGVRFGDKVAALMRQRLEFECQGGRWRTLAVSYADAKDVAIGAETAPADWRPIEEYPLLGPAKDAACLRRYNQTLVSRNLNLGDIVTNYHKAWGPVAPEPLTPQQQLKQRFEASH